MLGHRMAVRVVSHCESGLMQMATSENQSKATCCTSMSSGQPTRMDHAPWGDLGGFVGSAEQGRMAISGHTRVSNT